MVTICPHSQARKRITNDQVIESSSGTISLELGLSVDYLEIGKTLICHTKQRIAFTQPIEFEVSKGSWTHREVLRRTNSTFEIHKRH